MKLSAPYEVSKVGPPHYDDVGALAKALVKAAPERMLWATNWPHPSSPADNKPDDADASRRHARLGSRRSDPQEDLRRQSRAALRILRMARHRLALLGLGMAVAPHAKSLNDLRDRVEVAAAYSPTEARRAEFAGAILISAFGRSRRHPRRSQHRHRRRAHAAEHASRSRHAHRARRASMCCWRSRWRFRPSVRWKWSRPASAPA